ncbi:hypothetical protein [Sulfurimonas sp.]|uniref:hypothetical protein n=1 Tax=Sulfurimonas sp. TaxID=2022749 RepID=UPI003569F633
MRLKSLLLYSLLLSYSSLFSANVSNVNGFVHYGGIYFQDDMKVTTFIEHYDSSGGYLANIGSYPSKYYSMASSNIIQFTTKGECGGSYCHYTYDKYVVTTGSCPVDTVLNPETYHCEAPPAPSCNPDTEYLNENNECVLLTSAIPPDFPDNNTSNGVTSFGTVPTTEQGCKDMERYNSSLGIVEVIGWDYGTQTCKVVAFKCNSGRVFDQSTNKCIIPPDNTNFGSNSGCINDNWARRWTHDYCEDCVGQAGIWLPPIGHEESGMECNKAYIEYQCVKDYRIKKYVEVSCGEPVPTDPENHNIDMDNLTPSEVTDQNLSNLPTIDPTNANLSTIEGLRAIESAIKDNLNPKIDTINENLLTTNSKLSNIDNKLTSSNTKLDGIKSSLDNINGVLNTTGDGIDPSNMDIDVTPLDTTKSIMDNLTDNVSELTDGMTSIKTKFDETKSLLSGQQPVLNIGGGSCNDEHLAKFAGYISPYSSIFSLVVYVGFMISIFKMIFAYFARGE